MLNLRSQKLPCFSATHKLYVCVYIFIMLCRNVSAKKWMHCYFYTCFTVYIFIRITVINKKYTLMIITLFLFHVIIARKKKQRQNLHQLCNSLLKKLLYWNFKRLRIILFFTQRYRSVWKKNYVFLLIPKLTNFFWKTNVYLWLKKIPV